MPQPQQSGTSFRSSRHQAREAAAVHGNLHAVVNPSHAAGTSGLQGQAPMGDMLQLGKIIGVKGRLAKDTQARLTMLRGKA